MELRAAQKLLAHANSGPLLGYLTTLYQVEFI